MISMAIVCGSNFHAAGSADRSVTAQPVNLMSHVSVVFCFRAALFWDQDHGIGMAGTGVTDSGIMTETVAGAGPADPADHNTGSLCQVSRLFCFSSFC
jgi:hypothetical protein